MATFQKFNSFVEDLAEKKIDLSGSGLTVALTDSAPSASNTVIGNITQISYSNLSSRVITVSSSSQTSGTYKLVLTDLVLTASGAVGPFRYVVIYDDASATDCLIGWFDTGLEYTLANTDTFTCNFDGTNGLLQLT